MSKKELASTRLESLDDACAYLVAFARAHNLSGVELLVRADGRVDIAGRDYYTGRSTWTSHADTLSGSSLPLPSAVLSRKAGPQ